MTAPTRRRLTAEERRAGISKALIYEHFDSKQGLYADLLERNANELFERLAAALANVEVESGPRAWPPVSTPSSPSLRSAATRGEFCFATSPIRRRPPCSTASSSK